MGLKTKIDTGYKDKNNNPICVGDKIKKWDKIGIVIKTEHEYLIKLNSGLLTTFHDMEYIGRNNFEVINENKK